MRGYSSARNANRVTCEEPYGQDNSLAFAVDERVGEKLEPSSLFNGKHVSAGCGGLTVDHPRHDNIGFVILLSETVF